MDQFLLQPLRFQHQEYNSTPREHFTSNLPKIFTLQQRLYRFSLNTASKRIFVVDIYHMQESAYLRRYACPVKAGIQWNIRSDSFHNYLYKSDCSLLC